MSSCNGNGTSACASLAVDPAKRVKYNLGLVLGVDEFDQEQYFFLEQDRQHHRALHGYGTVCGLRLSHTDLDVFVAAGVAVNPQGKVLRVPRDQCANLADWIDAGDHRAQLTTCYGAAPFSASLYVLLCYRECETDKVPLPGAPCRTEEDSLAASRVTETFELRLSPHPPRADEEEAVRVFGDLLREIEIVDVSLPLTPIADAIAAIEARVRGLPALLTPGGWPLDPCAALGSPLGSPIDSPLGSPLGSPLDSGSLVVTREDAPEVLRAAFRVWATEVRPSLLAGRNCGVQPLDESCVLLGELTFQLRADGTIDPATLAIEQDERPILLHSRLLQEWLPGGSETTIVSDGGPEPLPLVLAGDASGPVAGTTVGALQGTPVAPLAPAAGEVLTGVPDAAAPGGVRWEPQPVAGGAPIPPLAGDVSGAIGNTTVDRLQAIPLQAPAPAAAQVLTAVDAGAGQIVWRPVTPVVPPPPPVVLGGDVTGNAGTNTISRLQTIPVDAPAPAFGEVLTVINDGGNPVWRATTPVTPPPPPVVLGGDVSGAAGANRIDLLQDVPVQAPLGSVSIGDVLMAFDGGGGNPVWRPTAPPAPPAGGNFIVAGGRFRVDGTTLFGFGGISVTQFVNTPILYFVEFADFSPDRNFILKGTAVTSVFDAQHTVEVVPPEDERLLELVQQEGIDPQGGLFIRVADENNEVPAELGFMLEISLFP